mmetsp:Transcript_2243/g.7398  ORF Transcript_2243/g.7398 Transcript_2243/m.7398 type:complete len:176 (+) Transcript_2243:272-799(+)
MSASEPSGALLPARDHSLRSAAVAAAAATAARAAAAAQQGTCCSPAVHWAGSEWQVPRYCSQHWPEHAPKSMTRGGEKCAALNNAAPLAPGEPRMPNVWLGCYVLRGSRGARRLLDAFANSGYTGAEHVDWQLSRLAHRGAVKMLVVSETNLVSVKRCHADARQKLDASGDRANT